MGQKSFEKAETVLQQEAFLAALNKAELKAEEIDMVFAGDLLNQCVGSSFGLRDFNIPYFGQYGACSTMAQGPKGSTARRLNTAVSEHRQPSGR